MGLHLNLAVDLVRLGAALELVMATGILVALDQVVRLALEAVALGLHLNLAVDLVRLGAAMELVMVTGILVALDQVVVVM